jgi:hypothetical protein
MDYPIAPTATQAYTRRCAENTVLTALHNMTPQLISSRLCGKVVEVTVSLAFWSDSFVEMATMIDEKFCRDVSLSGLQQQTVAYIATLRVIPSEVAPE